MGKKFDFEYIIVGSGPAGSAAATALAEAKKRVAIVEADTFGGASLNHSEIPYAASRKFSHLCAEIRRGGKLGVSALNLHFNLPTAVAWQRAVIKNVGGGDTGRFEAKNITCIKGKANFLDAHTIAVGEQKYTADNFILATGSKNITNTIGGADKVFHLTPETAMKVRRVPKAVLVVGGGKAGCETAEYFAELGSKVLIMEMSERILPSEDREVSETISDYFVHDLGMMVVPNTRVVALEEDDAGKRVVFVNGGQEKMVKIDTIVLAIGSKPILDYGLENAGVKYRKNGVVVDKELRTSAKNIFAIGGAVDSKITTEKAIYQGTFLANMLTTKSKNILNYHGFPRTINTYPEVAVVGLTEDDLIKRSRKYKKAIVYLDEVTASKTSEFERGFIKLLADKDKKIIGAVIVAPNASLMVQELAVAVRHHLSALEIASTPHLANSFGEAIRLAAKQLIKK